MNRKSFIFSVVFCLAPAAGFALCADNHKTDYCDCKCGKIAAGAVNYGAVDVVKDCCVNSWGGYGAAADKRCCSQADISAGKTWDPVSKSCKTASGSACTFGGWTADSSNGATTCGATPTAGCVQYSACGANGTPACSSSSTVKADIGCGGGSGYVQCDNKQLFADCEFLGFLSFPTCAAADGNASCAGKAAGYVCFVNPGNGVCVSAQTWDYSGRTACPPDYSEKDTLDLHCNQTFGNFTKVTCGSPYYKRVCN